MSDLEILRFCFTLAPIQSAMRRSADGGARLVIDVPQGDIAALNRLVDLNVATMGIVFHAAVVASDSPGSFTELDDHAAQEKTAALPARIGRRRATNQ